MSDDPWIPYNVDEDFVGDSDNELPSKGDLVWIFDTFYDGVTLGRWVGWWETAEGSDDVGVAAWTPLVKPPPPV